MNKKYDWVCGRCGSNDVTVEVTGVRWDVEAQEFAMTGEVCSKGHYCGDCDGECSIERVTLE